MSSEEFLKVIRRAELLLDEADFILRKHPVLNMSGLKRKLRQPSPFFTDGAKQLHEQESAERRLNAIKNEIMGLLFGLKNNLEERGIRVQNENLATMLSSDINTYDDLFGVFRVAVGYLKSLLL